ncbi:Serine carboxypeptidase-like 32 [Vitis vinifera]|uniref:Carboxypeptidase n=1 Tax=Vitis vinifera TaxID=29760 RepID=A0A438EF03_VITVI|nr:Serine carboxypeptidase-like 32 [Vitis vinifera]
MIKNLQIFTSYFDGAELLIWSPQTPISLSFHSHGFPHFSGPVSVFSMEPPAVDFRHYAGYVTVNEENGRALFYWFYEATTQPNEKPLVLWLNGGPGCSSVGYGATQEIGPLSWTLMAMDLNSIPTHGIEKPTCCSWNLQLELAFHTQIQLVTMKSLGMTLQVRYKQISKAYENSYTYHVIFNLIILHQLLFCGLFILANDNYAFLHKWFLKFPSYRKRIFYIAGESYAGKYVPELAKVIYDKNKDPSLFIDLRGILVIGLVDYAWSHAVVSDETHKIIRENCDFYSEDPWSNDNCSDAVGEVLDQYKRIDIYSLYTSVCTKLQTCQGSWVVMIHALMTMQKLSTTEQMFRRPSMSAMVTESRTGASAMRIYLVTGHNHSPLFFPIYRKLIAGGLRIWVYSGDTDGRVPVLSTRYCLSTLKLPITRAWRPWYHQQQVSGWFQEYKGLTFATFRGAGHAVPVFKQASHLHSSQPFSRENLHLVKVKSPLSFLLAATMFTVPVGCKESRGQEIYLSAIM